MSELLSECAMPRLMHHFVKRAVVMSMDRHDREREMVSVLLSALYGDVLAADDVEKGFLSLVKTVSEGVFCNHYICTVIFIVIVMCMAPDDVEKVMLRD